MKRTIFIAICSVLGLVAQAQPGGGNNLGSLELSVTEKYKARVAEASKIKGFPSFKDTTTQKLPVSYRISSTPLRVDYRPKPLSPAQIAKVPVENLKQGFVRAGVGFYGTPLVEGYWNSDRSSKNAYGFWGKHLSTQRGVASTIFEDNGFSHNELGAYYSRFYRKWKWSSQISGMANRQSYYGIPIYSTASDILYGDTEAPSIWRRRAKVSTRIENISNKPGYYESGNLSYSFFNTNFQTTEHYVSTLNQFVLPAGNTPLQIDLGLEYLHSNYDSLVPQNAMRDAITAQLRPHIETTYKSINFDFGLNVFTNTSIEQYGMDTSYTELFFFPELQVNYPLVKDVLAVYGGLKSRLINNSNQRIANDNPFVLPLIGLYGGGLQPTFERDLFIGVKGILSGSASFNLKGGYMQNQNQILYYRDPSLLRINNSLDSSLPGLQVRYDDVDIFYVRGELNFNYHDNLQLNLHGELRSFSTKTESEAWHLPSFTAGLQAAYTVREKIELNADLNYIGQRIAFEQSLEPLIQNELDGYFDANIGVEYLYNSRLSAFVQVYNLINTPNTLFLGYDAQGVNVLFGIAYQF
jgi:hypothetical protein